MTSKIYLIDEEDFRQLIATSFSYTEALRKIGMSHGRSSMDIIKRRCNELNISCDHFIKTGNQSSSSYSFEDIFKENSSYKNMTRLKEKILANNLLEYKCACCGNTGVWLNQPLTLQLDHINGNHQDHRISNLRFLCPNCHTQTETYGSKRGTKSV